MSSPKFAGKFWKNVGKIWKIVVLLLKFHSWIFFYPLRAGLILDPTSGGLSDFRAQQFKTITGSKNQGSVAMFWKMRKDEWRDNCNASSGSSEKLVGPTNQ